MLSFCCLPIVFVAMFESPHGDYQICIFTPVTPCKRPGQLEILPGQGLVLLMVVS